MISNSDLWESAQHHCSFKKVLDKWTSVLYEGGVLNAVYMDFMKAFDKVPHTRLLVKMKAYGLSENICIWVQNFLSDRKQCVQVSGMKSQWHKVTSGIPQSPDDTILFREIKDDSDASSIQSDLNELFKWSETWLLKFHPNKCKICQCSIKMSSM